MDGWSLVFVVLLSLTVGFLIGIGTGFHVGRTEVYRAFGVLPDRRRDQDHIQ